MRVPEAVTAPGGNCRRTGLLFEKIKKEVFYGKEEETYF
jgi:hypothetical protein